MQLSDVVMGRCSAKFRRLFINVILKESFFIDPSVIVESFPFYGFRAFRALSRRITVRNFLCYVYAKDLQRYRAY